MFRATRLRIKAFSYALVLNLLGCSFLGPVIGDGYNVRIGVSDKAGVSIEDLLGLDEIISSEGFCERRVSTGKGECVNYYRELTETQFAHLRGYKGISLGYCYTKGSSPMIMITGFSVSIFNNWIGQDSAVKAEIDRVAQMVRRYLEGHFGDNVHQESMRTGPPF